MSQEQTRSFLNNIASKAINAFPATSNTAYNGYTYITSKFYYSIIFALLILLFGLFYYLNNNQNIFKILNTEYDIVIWLVLIALSIYTLLFFANKKYNTINTPGTSSETKMNFLNLLKPLVVLSLIILFPILIINIILHLHVTNNNFFNITQNILGLLLIIITLAIITKVFSIQKSSADDCDGKDGVTFKYILCILKNIIFFIPCLLVIVVDEIHNDIRLTPSSIDILFFALIILITLIFSLPLLFSYFAKHNKNDVLAGEGPFYLNEKRTLGKYQNLDKNITDAIAIPNFNTSNDETNSNSNLENDPLATKMTTLFSYFNTNSSTNNSNNSNENSSNEDLIRNEYNKDTMADNIKGYDFKLFDKDLNGRYNIGAKYSNSSKITKTFPYNYTYSLSFYIYINPQPTNTSIAYTKDTELFNYGFKPVIYYNGNSRKIIIKSRTISNKSNQLDTIYETSNVKHQKWIYFVINYEDNIIDVFIDGKLVGSKSNVTPYFIGDSVTIGEDNGIYGSIKDVYYFDKKKTPDSIQFLYNLTKNKNAV